MNKEKGKKGYKMKIGYEVTYRYEVELPADEKDLKSDLIDLAEIVEEGNYSCADTFKGKTTDISMVIIDE